ncbi:voltage gated chloride channel [Sphaerosporella brunnea]|uniref:Chloride channel protein n=1 Tax=Sphaerosporella brunnea TaxID=1250544 RepID=A0A5J5ES43_9PEZI|nr:voltage gated chloride channel [Sphaerosporella brunnea]
MNVPHQRNLRRLSISSRLSFAISTHSAEAGTAPEHIRPAEEHIEEIEEIRRYEDFTTIDWVQDAARAQLQREIARKNRNGFFVRGGGATGWRRKLWESYDAGQAWIVITIIGIAIGLNASFLNIVTEWLSDIKRGHCTTAFYLNEKFCCWGAEGTCDEWKPWSRIWPINYLLYIIFSTLFAFTAAILVKSFAPYAAGSGISEIKCIIAGFVMKGFLGWWTLFIKSIGLPLAIASGLSVGKEGPSVHYAVCTGNVISRLFDKYKRNASKMREIMSACAAAGVGVAFGSPIGGVLFSLEEMSSNFPLKTMWRSYFCALVATAVLATMNPFRTGQLVMFQVSYDRDWHFFEVVFFIILGVFGGLYGEFVIQWNLRAQAFRKHYLTKYAVAEATFLAGATAVICYWNTFLRIDMTESMEILFKECEGGHDFNGLCQRGHRWSMVFSLTIATIIRIFLVIISYGCKVPAGIFVPSMAIGASFGRTVGILVQALHETMPDARFFSSCKPDVPCITPGTYAFLGAAAALSGIMHITVSVVVIMFELTGALTYILPTMIVVGVTKAVSDRFGKGGIADRMIWFNGFPFLDNKEDHSFGVPVSQVMNEELTVLPASGTTVEEIEQILDTTKYQGFPIVQDRSSQLILGYINRTELKYGVDRAKRERSIPPNARCFFTPPPRQGGLTPISATVPVSGSSFPSGGGLSVDFARFIDPTPLTVHPRLPLETVMEIFKKVGPRVVLVEHRGKLRGIVTRKDVLRFQFKVENREHPRSEDDIDADRFREEKLWELIVRSAEWVRRKLRFWERDRVALRHDRAIPDGVDLGRVGEVELDDRPRHGR